VNVARNERFAAARQRERITEGQLAELVVRWVWEHRQREVHMDADHVSRIERGRITWPNSDYRAAFRAVLDAPSDADLGFYSQRKGQATTPRAIDVEGDLLALAGAATIGGLGKVAMSSVSAGLGTPGAPARIGLVDVADLQHVIAGMERADHAAGGRTVVRSVALGQLAWAQDTLRLASFHGADTRAAWMSAVARLGRLAGFMSMDAREHDAARRCFVLSLQIAAEAEDWPGRLNVLSGLARQAVHLGDGPTALRVATLARAGESTASATTRAMLRVLEARAFGVLGRQADAVAAVRQAEDFYEGRQSDQDPPWLWFYDEAQLLGDTGHALYPLALAGADVDAAERLAKAVQLHNPADTRGRTFSLTKLATLQVASEPGPFAYANVREAIAAVAGLRSGRAQDFLAELGRVLRRVDDDQAAELAASISSTLAVVRRA
jgi:hypothetical protein